VGGGLELALSCDIRIAADHAQLGLMEPKRGLVPGGGGMLRLPRLMPFGLAMEVLLTADLIDAKEAHRVGLVNQVVPLPDLMPAAEKMAERILANGPLAVRKVKEMTYRAMDVPMPLAWRLDLGPNIYESEDAKEGTAAFAQKRQPVWKGK
ncbi:MAG: enoyl-CoA hydratase-related protein, partial [Chloroflexota bacterium]|nr:enoyl-CoA hydratase-related protein [Chloroflexota bacterium]